jgi:hypothetical protein
MFTMYARSAPAFMVLTNKRLYFMPVSTWGTPTKSGDIAHTVLDRPLQMKTKATRLYKHCDLLDTEGKPIFRLKFHPFDWRDSGRLASNLSS